MRAQLYCAYNVKYGCYTILIAYTWSYMTFAQTEYCLIYIVGKEEKFFLPPPNNGAALSRVFTIMRHGVAQENSLLMN